MSLEWGGSFQFKKGPRRPGQPCWPKRCSPDRQIWRSDLVFGSDGDHGGSHSNMTHLRVWDQKAPPSLTGDKCPKFVTLSTATHQPKPECLKDVLEVKTIILVNPFSLFKPQHPTLCNFQIFPAAATYQRRWWLPANDGGATFFSGEPIPKPPKPKH